MKISPTIAISSGNYFDLENPLASKFTIRDIAHALANTCRFNGHTSSFYSVAQHSVHVAQIVPAQHKRAALFHDAAEAFIGDITTPLKELIPEFKRLEEKIERAVFSKLRIPYPLPDAVKQADLILLKTEKRDLLPREIGPWPILHGIQTLQQKLYGMPPTEAEQYFLSYYRKISAAN